MNTMLSPATLASGTLVDSGHPAVIELAARASGSCERERAVSLYKLVRDGFRYDPYRIDVSEAGMRASTVIAQGFGWCVTKAALLAAAARAAGIPARLGYADVRNHLSTQRMRDMLRTDLFIWHSFTQLWVKGRWLKASPTFNIELCERFGLLPLEWDAVGDSLHHPYDRARRRHMEYVNDRGSYDDIPRERIATDFAATYPAWRLSEGVDEFQRDVEREIR